MLKETRYIDEKTGEIKHSNVRHIAAAFDEERGYLFWARKSFTKSFIHVPFPKQMSCREIGRMAILSKQIWSNTNMLGRRIGRGIKPLTTKDIGRVIGVRERQAQRFIEKMVRLGMMARVKVKVENKTQIQFYLNPIHYFSSNRIPLNLYLIFKKQLDAFLPDWVKREYAVQKGKAVSNEK